MTAKMAKRCKYCDSLTTKADRICPSCEEKLILIRQIKAMLAPYVEKKKGKNK